MKNVITWVLGSLGAASLMATAPTSWAQSPGPKPTVPALLPAPKAPLPVPQVNLGPKEQVAPVAAVAKAPLAPTQPPTMQTLELTGAMLENVARSDPGSLKYGAGFVPPSPLGVLTTFPYGIQVAHSSVPPNGMVAATGEDTIFPRSSLRPGWTVKSVVVSGTAGSAVSATIGFPKASVTQSGKGTSALLVKVHWESMGNPAFFYHLKFTVEGPAGTSPL